MTEIPAPTPEQLLQAVRVAQQRAEYYTANMFAQAFNDPERMQDGDILGWLASALPALLADRARLDWLSDEIASYRRDEETGEEYFRLDWETGWCANFRAAVDADMARAASEEEEAWPGPAGPDEETFEIVSPLPCSESTDTNG